MASKIKLPTHRMDPKLKIVIGASLIVVALVLGITGCRLVVRGWRKLRGKD